MLNFKLVGFCLRVCEFNPKGCRAIQMKAIQEGIISVLSLRMKS